MNVGRRNSARALAAGALFAILAFLVLVQYAPDAVAFSPNNYGWDGIEGVASTYNVNFTTSLSALPPNSVLVVIQPSINYSSSDAKSIRAFVEGGGTLFVADKSGVANSLLAQVGSAISIQPNESISDRTYNWKSPSFPTALVLPAAQSQLGFLSKVRGIALSQPAPLLTSGAKAFDLAITSQFSTSLSASSGATARGPFIVMAGQKLGNGTIVVVGDSQFLLNSEWTIADNKALIGNLFTNSTVLIDASHWGLSSIARLKADLRNVYSFLGASPVRYIVTLCLVGAALLIAPGGGKEEAAGPRGRPGQTTPFNEKNKGVEE
jgi:hypothetical protein